MLTIRSRRRIFALMVALGPAFVTTPADAQDRIEPAAGIRVVEVQNPLTGRVAREVVGLLSPAEVLRLQVELAAAGFDPGVRTGALDRPTRDALAALQAARGLEICGCPTYETVVALGVLPLVVSAGAAASSHEADGRYDRSSRGVVYVAYPVNVYSVGWNSRRFRDDLGPAVIVGHHPARGAGNLDHRSPPPRPQGSGGFRPAPRRPGGQITAGQRPASPGQRAARPNRF